MAEGPTQAELLTIPEQPAPAASPEGPRGKRKLKPIDRQQCKWVSLCVEDLIPADHKARAIWELTGRLDLEQFAAPIRSEQGQAGRSAWDPRLLVSVWLYAYSEGMGSARRIAHWMSYEPGLRWLSGLEVVNYHTLSDFRVVHREALEKLFAELLGLLDAAGVISLERVMHDGTKIRAQAGVDTFRREKTLQQRMAVARELLAELGDPGQESEGRSREEAAQARARQEQVKRLEEAIQELDLLRAATEAEKREHVRVSLSEPEARMMKHGDQAIAPSYNAQLSTDAKRTVVVAAELTQAASDAQELPAAVRAVKKNVGRKPRQVVVDGGYTNRATIEAMEKEEVDLIGSLPSPAERTAAGLKAQGIDPQFGPRAFVLAAATNTVQCPAGKSLVYLRRNTKRDRQYVQYRSRPEDCRDCPFQPRCCPRPERGRTVSLLVREAASVAAFRKRMDSDEAREIYRQRGPIAEFPNACIKERIGLRKFRLRGLVRAGTELLWACLTYNVMQWKRLCWRPAAVPAAAT
jgi:transposase